MRNWILFFLLLVYFENIVAQPTDKKLQKKIEAAISGFDGDIGIYIKNLKNGKTVAINADTVFPTASIVKVPIMVGVAHKLLTGELHYDSLFTYKDSLLYEGEDILGSYKNNEKIALKNC